MRVLAISVLVAGVLLPQQDQADRPVFRSGVSLVRLDVRIVDGAGRPIADIRSDEIEIAEAGAKRPLLLFQRVAGAGGSYVELAQRTIASVVREPGGIVGSADRRFSVRSLNGAGVAATDFIIASPGDALPVRAVAYSEGNLTGTLRLYAPTLVDLDSATGHLELTSAADGSAGGTSRTSADTIGDAVTVGSRSMRDVLFAMPLSQLEAGQYVARAIVRVKGEIVADLRRPVEVILGAAPAAATAKPADRQRASNVLQGDIAQGLSRRASSSSTDTVRRGLAELGREQYAEATALLGAAFEMQPDDAALAFVLGWARSGAGDRTGAVTAFRNAVLHEPTMVPAYLALAETYVALGHPALAIQAAEAGLKAVPQSVELTRLLSSIRK